MKPQFLSVLNTCEEFVVLQPPVRAFIESHKNESIEKLALYLSGKQQWPARHIIQQIEAFQKLKYKVPEWCSTSGIVFPQRVSIEQSSSSKTAQYKSRLISGEILVDMTGGLGVDSYFFTDAFSKVYYLEQQEHLAALAKHNFEILQKPQIEVCAVNSVQWLQNVQFPINALYVDPARRDSHNRKIVTLEHCEPNILQFQDLCMKKASVLLLKTSPMLDIKFALHRLKNIREVHVVSVDNECKEVLYVCVKGNTSEPKLVAIDLGKNYSNRFEFTYGQEKAAKAPCEPLGLYLLEPNSAVRKAGAFELPATRFGLAKLHTHTHLYTSAHIPQSFPGFIYKVLQNIPYSSKKQVLMTEDHYLNIKCYNFPESVSAIKKVFKLKDGGTRFGFFYTDLNQKLQIAICEKIMMNP